jgi:hypothetical protein
MAALRKTLVSTLMKLLFLSYIFRKFDYDKN